MTFEEHSDKICDKCQEYPKRWRLPFLFKDMDDMSHKDLGKGYRQYYVCDKCKELEGKLLKAQGHDSWNNHWIDIEIFGED